MMGSRNAPNLVDELWRPKTLIRPPLSRRLLCCHVVLLSVWALNHIIVLERCRVFCGQSNKLEGTKPLSTSQLAIVSGPGMQNRYGSAVFAILGQLRWSVEMCLTTRKSDVSQSSKSCMCLAELVRVQSASLSRSLDHWGRKYVRKAFRSFFQHFYFAFKLNWKTEREILNFHKA